MAKTKETKDTQPEVEKVIVETEVVSTEEKTSKPEKKDKKPVKKQKTQSKPKKKSKKYSEKVSELGDARKKHSAKEAIALVKKLSYTKFDGTINLAVKLEKSKKAEDAIRGTINLPNGTGKKLKVVVVNEDIIESVKKGKIDFDILVASPSMMPKLGVLAKILGPKGKMPNPKDGTVSENPEQIVENLSERIVRYRSDLGRNIHIAIGKVSWDDEKLLENYTVAMKTLNKLRIESVTISPTMGAGVKIDIKSI